MKSTQSTPVRFYALSGFGASFILALGVVATAYMWEAGFQGVELAQESNLQSALFFSDLAHAGQSIGPWLVLTTNGILCKFGIKKWRKWLKKKFKLL